MGATMNSATGNVLPLHGLPRQSSLRTAVAQIIRAIGSDFALTDAKIADFVDVSRGTIENAREEKGDLNAGTIARLGAVFGCHYVDPYHKLYGARAVPLNPGQPDALPAIANVVSLLAASGPGVPAHPQLLAMMPTLRQASAAITALIELGEKVAT